MIWRKSLLVFIASLVIALLAAGFRFSDSSHAIGMLSLKGGKGRHPFVVETGHSLYTLIMTGKILPPFRGDIRIALEGEPGMNYALYNSEPIFDLGLHRHPELDGTLLRSVQPGDRVALWVVMQPALPADGQAEYRGFLSQRVSAYLDHQSRNDAQGDSSGLALCFYAVDSGRRLLRLPIVLADVQKVERHGS